MFAEAKMNNVNVNHGSWQTTSLLSLLKVELQVANAALTSTESSVSWDLRKTELQMLF